MRFHFYGNSVASQGSGNGKLENSAAPFAIDEPVQLARCCLTWLGDVKNILRRTFLYSPNPIVNERSPTKGDALSRTRRSSWLCNKTSSRHRRSVIFFFFCRYMNCRFREAPRRAENRSARSPPSNTLVIPSGQRAVMNVSGDSRQRGMPPATNNAALFIGAASNPVSLCAHR